MRVLHVIDHLGLGGAQSALVDLLTSRHRADADVLALRDRDDHTNTDRLRRAGVVVFRAGLTPQRPWRLRHLVRRLRSGQYDIVHAHLEWSCHLVGALVLSCRRPRPKLVLQTDNDPRTYSWWHRVATSVLQPHADAQTVPGRSVALALRELVGREMPALREIPLCVCSERFGTELAAPGEVRELRAGAEIVVGSVGRLVPQKNLSLLLRALPALLRQRPGLRLLVVGDGPLRRPLEAEARALGLAHAVAFTGIRTDLATVYAALDVLALPSRHEGQGLVLLEAMAAGVPVVGTAVVGIVDVVRHEENGLLVPPDEPAALTAALLRLTVEQPLRRRLAERAYEEVRSRYSIGVMVAATESLYASLLA